MRKPKPLKLDPPLYDYAKKGDDAQPLTASQHGFKVMPQPQYERLADVFGWRDYLLPAFLGGVLGGLMTVPFALALIWSR